MNRKSLEVHPAVHEGRKDQAPRGLPLNDGLRRRPKGRAGLFADAQVTSHASPLSDDVRGPFQARAGPAFRSTVSNAVVRDRDRGELPVIFERFLTVAEVLTLTSWSRSTLYRSIRNSRFPKPRLLSANRIGFLLSEVASWVGSRDHRRPQ